MLKVSGAGRMAMCSLTPDAILDQLRQGSSDPRSAGQR
jgi:hypothetical protein